MDGKSVIFDMDGVIFDPEKAVFSLWKETADRLGLKDIESVYLRTVGVNENESRRIFKEEYGEDFPFDSLRDEIFVEYHRRYDGGRLPRKPGAEVVLKKLHEEGFRMGLASSTRSALVTQQLREAGVLVCFDAVVGGEMVKRSKPRPDIFLKAAELLGCEPGQTYIVEDSFNGIRAAREGGFISIMVPDMLMPDREMKEKATYIASDLYEAYGILTGEKG